MVKNSITVFSRLRNSSPDNKVEYFINKADNHEEISIYNKFGCSIYKFTKVFDHDNTQAEIFEHVAKPVVKSVLDGVNGTIFAYGQTGSGKTYSISGCSKSFTERGMIPRTLEYIFDYIKMLKDDFTISISYLEIYNETIFDLLKKSSDSIIKHNMPRITVLQGKRGGMLLKNLKTISVTNVREALKLLIIGETNRATAETLSNDCSSRSHCIFTIHLKIRNDKSNYIKCSKLNIIDLAGSERVYKSNLNGVLLKEAQHINLSLHYLEHVILSLSENKKHVPYRNCVMTYLLKDSLTGNCLTVMLATLSTDKHFFQETVTTCKFAQRVAQLHTNVQTNIVQDPQYQIQCLKLKIAKLEKELERISNFKGKEDLTIEEQDEILSKLEEYLEDDNEHFEIEQDMSVIQFCFKTLKSRIITMCKEKNKLILASGDLKKNSEESLSSLDYIPEREVKCHMLMPLSETNFLEKRNELFKEFLGTNKHHLEVKQYVSALNNKFNMAKVCSETIKGCQQNIDYIKEKLTVINRQMERQQLTKHLSEQQHVYKESVALLQQIKSDTNSLQEKLQKEKLNLLFKFKTWLINEKKCSITNAYFENSTNNDKSKDLQPTNSFDSNNMSGRGDHKEDPDNLTIYFSFSELLSSFGKDKISENDNVSENNKIIETNDQKANSNANVEITQADTSKSSIIPNVTSNINNTLNNNIKVNPVVSYPTYVEYFDSTVNNKKDKANELDEDSRDAYLTSISEVLNDKSVKKASDEPRKKENDEESKCNHENQKQDVHKCVENECTLSQIEEEAENTCSIGDLFLLDDSEEFKNFMKAVTLTGDVETDKEILKFYRDKYKKV